MNVWVVLGSMLAGGVIVKLFDRAADRKYHEGKREATMIWKGGSRYDGRPVTYMPEQVPMHQHRRKPL